MLIIDVEMVPKLWLEDIKTIRKKRHYHLRMAQIFLKAKDMTNMHLFSMLAEKNQTEIDAFEKFYDISCSKA